MPKRSNEFQKLVYIIKNHAAAGAIVTESKLLRDNTTGAEREVDICIESSIAGHPIIISIECRDHARPADVKWVEEMKAKHERLPTKTLVLISRSGFSKEAKEVSKIYGIEILSMEECDESFAERFFGDNSPLYFKHMKLIPNKVIIRVDSIDGLSAENVEVFPDTLIYKQTGEQICTAKDMVENILNTKKINLESLSKSDNTHKGFEVIWKQAKERVGNTYCLQKLEPVLIRPIESIKITGICNFDITELTLQHGKIGNVNVAWGTISLEGENALLVVSKQPENNETATISITDEQIKTLKKIES